MSQAKGATFARLGAAALLCCACGAVGHASAATLPPNEQVAKLIAERVSRQKWATGVVVAVTGPSGRRTYAYGTFGRDDPRPVTADTLFEIASITKVFTALLLADMVRRQEVRLDDPVARCLPPAAVKVPARGERQITLVDLATHTSGLPLRPPNLRSQTALDKYAGYTLEQLYAGLSSYTLDRDIGTQFRYSNWGFGLLGQALSRCAQRDYFALLDQRIITPLQLHDTTAFPTPEMRRRLARGHDSELVEVPNEGHGVLDPAGSLYSTANDLMTLLEAFLGRSNADIAASMSAMLAVQRPTDDPQTKIALAWRVTERGPLRIVWSNGRPDGYRSYIGFDPNRRIGVVGLANAATNTGVDDIAEFLLDPSRMPVQAHRKIAIDPAELGQYVGRYRFEDQAVLTVTRAGGQLISQMTDQGPIAIFPTGKREFMPDDVEARIVFDPPRAGAAPALTLRQDGVSYRGVRIP